MGNFGGIEKYQSCASQVCRQLGIATDFSTSKCMHGMNQTRLSVRDMQEVPKSKFEPNRPSSIGGITRYLLRMRTIGHVT